jgi:hypothetical protein
VLKIDKKAAGNLVEIQNQITTTFIDWIAA